MRIIQDGNQARYKPSRPRKVGQSLLLQAYGDSGRNIAQAEAEGKRRERRGWVGWGGVSDVDAVLNCLGGVEGVVDLGGEGGVVGRVVGLTSELWIFRSNSPQC